MLAEGVVCLKLQVTRDTYEVSLCMLSQNVVTEVGLRFECPRALVTFVISLMAGHVLLQHVSRSKHLVADAAFKILW